MNTEDRISELEAKIAELQESQREAYKQISTAQREQWQGRIDDLELQAHLGAMEANERVQPLLADVRSRWEQARAQLDAAGSTAAGVTDTLRTGLEGAVNELRQAMRESGKRIRS